MKGLLQSPGKRGWAHGPAWAASSRGRESGGRAGLHLPTARGTRGLSPQAQEAVTQKTNQKQKEQRPEAISLFPLPRQAAAGQGRPPGKVAGCGDTWENWVLLP